jgi:hypothetical protein
LLRSPLQQGQDGVETGEARLARNEPLCQPEMIETNSASRTDKPFWNAASIVVIRTWVSLPELNPYHRKRQPQFFNSPQLSMSLPI